MIGLPVSPPEGGSPFYSLNPEYTDAVWRAVGDPLAFPLVPDPVYADRIVSFIQGLVLTGSAYDLDPTRYGQVPHEKLKSPDCARDEFDRLVLERAFEQALPVLGLIGFPSENLPMALMRPLSGSGSLGLLTDMVNEYGVDALFTRIGHHVRLNGDHLLRPRSVFRFGGHPADSPCGLSFAGRGIKAWIGSLL